MRLPDREKLKATLVSHNSLIFSFAQIVGNRSRQEDVFLENNADLFVLADGMGGLPNGDVAAQLTAESALWTCLHLKKRPSYWRNKHLLGERIVRSANTTVYKKQQEKKYTPGMGSTLLVVLFGEKNVNVYSVGDTLCGRFRNDSFSLVTLPQRNEKGQLTQAIGVQKTPPEHIFFRDEWKQNDIYLMATDGIIDWVNTEEINHICRKIIRTNESLGEACRLLIELAQKNGSNDNMSVCLITSI